MLVTETRWRIKLIVDGHAVVDSDIDTLYEIKKISNGNILLCGSQFVKLVIEKRRIMLDLPVIERLKRFFIRSDT